MRRAGAGLDRRAGGIRTPQGAGFSPAALIPTLWQRPEDRSSTGTDVDAWANGGGSVGGTLTGAGATRPQVASLNGFAAVQFVRASTDFLTAGVPTVGNVIGAASGWSAFIVIRPDSITSASPFVYTSEGWLIGYSVGGGYWGIFTRLVGGLPKVAAYQWDGASKAAEDAVTVGAAQLIQATWKGPASPIRMRVGSAAEVLSPAANAIAVTTENLREGQGAAAVYADGLLAEPLCFNRELAASEIAAVRSYYAGRYGVAV